MKKRITIEDIAQASHVSVATVSLVMRGRTGINIETRKRVEQVARALGYQRRQSRHEQHVQRISVLMCQQPASNTDHDTIESRILHGIEDVCRRRGIRNDVRQVVLDDITMANKPILFPQHYEYDGVIGVGVTANHDISNAVRDANIPCVLVDVDVPSVLFDSVHVDYEQAMNDLVAYLVALGHRSVMLFDNAGGSHTWQSSMKQAMHRFGMIDPFVCIVDPSPNAVQEHLHELFQYHPHVSVIVCRNDVCAMHVVQQLQYMGRYVPQTISVVGFHDMVTIPNNASLTTVRVDADALGVLAVQTLLHRIEWPNMPRIITTVQATLVIRQSTQPHSTHG